MSSRYFINSWEASRIKEKLKTGYGQIEEMMTGFRQAKERLRR